MVHVFTTIRNCCESPWVSNGSTLAWRSVYEFSAAEAAQASQNHGHFEVTKHRERMMDSTEMIHFCANIRTGLWFGMIQKLRNFFWRLLGNLHRKAPHFGGEIHGFQKFPSNQSMVLICDSKCQRLFGSVPSTPMKENCKWETVAVLKWEIRCCFDFVT